MRGVSRSFWTGGLLSRRRVDAVRDVSFNLTADRPEIFTIIGESGSGKSTLARMILNSMSPTAGSIRFGGEDLETIRKRRDGMRFMGQVQPIFQNPFESFNPLKQVDRYLTMTARNFTEARAKRKPTGHRTGRCARSDCRWRR